MHQKVCRGGVQLDRSGTRDEVKELGGLGVKRGSLDRIHGDECDVVEDVNFNPLNKNAVEGSVDAVPDGGGGGRELGAISFVDEFLFAEGGAFLGWEGLVCGGGGWGRWGGISRGS